jgi:hypothetical protein
MRPYKFNLDSNFYQELHKRLENQRVKHNERSPSSSLWGSGYLSGGLFSLIPKELRELYSRDTVPSIKHLETLVETAFWTSLQREEGRELRFTIKYVPKVWKEFSLLFKKPIPFNVANLRKLAPSLNRAYAGVTVSTAEEGLEICELTDAIAEPVSIKVIDPGQLIVSFVTSNVAAISGDEPVFFRDELLSWNKDIWSIFTDSESVEKFSAFSEPRVATIINIAREMRRAGHGGTLLVIPTGANIENSIDYIAYEIDSESKVASEYLMYYLEAKNKQETNKADKDIAESVKLWEKQLNIETPKFIAQLTSVDGATLLSSNLDVLGFGARLKAASNATFSHLVRVDPLDHSNWLEKVNTDKITWGTRHKSAARFVFDNQNSIAIVTSQDGYVTAYVWIESATTRFTSVYSFERLELTLF